MSRYNPVTPTIQGQAMIAESLKTETGLVFTKVEWGDGIVSSDEQYPTFTALKNKVIESPISKMERQDATLYITSVVNNSTLSTGFYCREIGVWAKIGANGTERLFAYTYAENASYTPSSDQYNEKRIRIGLGVDADVNVTIKFNSEVYLTRQELEDHDADSTAHAKAFAAHNTAPTAHPDKLVNLTTNGNSLRAVKGDGTNVDVVVPYAVGTTQANPKNLGSYATNKISDIRDLLNNELADMNKKGCSVRFIRLTANLTTIYNNWAKNWDATMGPWGTIYGVMSLLSDDTYANVELIGWTGTTVLLQRIAGTWKTAETKVYTNGMLNVADTLKLQSNELTLDMGGGTQTNINIGQAPKNYSGSGFTYTFYNGKNSLADLVAKSISANVYGSYSYSPPVNLAGKTIADFRSTLQSAMASISQGGKTIVVFTGDFSGIISNWDNTTFSIVAGPTFSVEISNIAYSARYAHCKVYTYYNEEYNFYISAGTWSAIDRNVLVSGLSQKVTTELATHNSDKQAHGNIINAIPRISILTGMCSDGETIPLPDGYTESQCKFFVSIAKENPSGYWFDVAESGAKNMLRVDCYTEGRILRCAMLVEGYDGWKTGNNSGTAVGPRIGCFANYMVIGIKYGG